MTPVDRIIGLAGIVLLLATLVGLLVRRRWRVWYAFTAYQAAVAGFAIAFLVHRPWYHPRAFLLQTNVVNVVRLLMVLEVAVRTFRAFPGARSTLRKILLVLLVVTLSVLVVPTSTNDYQNFLAELQPRMTNATVWIYTAILALILWYRLPVHPLIKSVLIVYVPYLLWDANFMRAWLLRAWEHDVLRYGSQSIYLAMVAYWAWIAWRPDAHDGGRNHGDLDDRDGDGRGDHDDPPSPSPSSSARLEDPPEERDGR